MRKKENVYDVIKNDDRFTILSKILKSTGIGRAMREEREAFTFFAPTDAAFNNLSENALKVLTSPEGQAVAAAILGQHLIPKSYLFSYELRRCDTVKTMHGNELKISEEANVLQLEEAHILMPGIAALNAVIFPVDKVLPAQRCVMSAQES